MVQTSSITQFIHQLGWSPEFRCKLLASGYGNDNYRLTFPDQESYVLRKKRHSEFPDSLQREHTLYSFLEAQKCTFTPRSIHFDPTENILLETLLPGKETLLSQLSSSQIQAFAKQLFTLHALDIATLKHFCRTHSLPALPETNKLTAIQQYGFNRFQDIDPAVVDTEIISWIASRLDKNYQVVCAHSDSTTRKILWGDVQDSVFIDEHNHLFFFDFEHTTIGYGNDLSYIYIHGGLSTRQFETLLTEYTTQAAVDVATLWSDILTDVEITRVNDVIWAARQWSLTGEEKYEKLTKSRQTLAER
jgi:hypothetical protein